MVRLRLTRLFDLLLLAAAALLGGRLAGGSAVGGNDVPITLAVLAVGLLAAGAGLARTAEGAVQPLGLGMAALGAVCGFLASPLTGLLALAVAPATVVYLSGLRSLPVARPLAGGAAAALAVLAPWGALLAALLVAARELARRTGAPGAIVDSEGATPTTGRPHGYGLAALSAVGLVVAVWPWLPVAGFDPTVLVGGVPAAMCLLAAAWMLLAADARRTSVPTPVAPGGRWAAVWLDAALVCVGGALAFGL